ncbi:MAG: hypothetical protein U9R75_00350 [Candidatus Thermoplasmatota archaeon]|nr:hypothetical protein [Candidatus Thermoplasmatota archaeon]
MEDDMVKEKKHPSIVMVGIGGGGSRILSDGLAQIVDYDVVDRYQCLGRAIRANTDEPLCFIVDTSSDPTREGFFDNIPKKHKISLSTGARGMSRGAGGRPGRAAKAILNNDVVKNLAENLYKPISDVEPAIVVIVHTADGGTGGGLTPEILQHLGYSLPGSTIFWVFTVLPQRTALSLKGPRTVAPVMGKLLKTARRISTRDFTNIPYQNRDIINRNITRKEADQSYEFQHSRIAIFPVSNEHFAQCWKGTSKKTIREEVLNPFPIELLSQALYPFLKYTVADPEEQTWMSKNWPLGPIDIPDIMAGLTPDRPFVIPHLWVDPKIYDTEDTDRVVGELTEGKIDLEQIDVLLDDGIPDLYTFTGTSAPLFENRVTSLYCIPVYPEGSEYFDDFGDFVGDEWFPKVSGKLNFITGREGLKLGVISHAANLKPQPIPGPEKGGKLGFDNGLLVTLLFGAIPLDLPIWLEATRDIVKGYKTEDFWEIGGYDANDWLRELATYIGWNDWPFKKYMDV